MQKNNFFERVYQIVRKIPEGKVATYGQISKLTGVDPRMVGWALHANKDSSDVPCHRVVNKEGGLAPGYAFGGPNEQKNRLISEDVDFIDESHVDLEKYRATI